ncbi:hypothetical protein [Liquorilactobacillus satsumensis]|uniref:hypothetical protein n=1 Tax=Liquorilactobacillus satsumensis TaxID=259059 RepID=UPI00345DF644
MDDKKEPKFWKGDAVAGFVYGMFGGLFVGILNIAFLHVWHLGLIVWIVVWLTVGTQPKFKDKRTPEQIKDDDSKFWNHVHEENEKDKEEKALKAQRPVVQNITINEQPKKKYKRHAPKCPKCKSHDIQVLDNRRKAFSLGKAAIGGVIYGGIGTIVGFAGKRGKKYDAICMQCGKKFKIKF